MSLFLELQRRNVLRVAMAYVALAWLVVQVLDSLAPMFGISDGMARLIVILMAIGLVPVLAISWLFELTPEGFKLESEVDHSMVSSRTSARRLDKLIIGALALAVVYFAVDKFVIDPARDEELVSEVAEKARAEALVGSFGDRSIAVLPFVDASAGENQAYLSDGIAEEIINLLSTVQDIRVISKSSSFALRDQALSLSEVAERLNVRYIMEGTVRRAGEQLRITAQMIDPHTGTALWSQNFDRAFGDIFAIQDEIAGEVVDKLEVELVGAKPESRPVDPEAWALYLRAKNLANKQEWRKSQDADALLAESLAIDPNIPDSRLLYWTILAQKVYFTDYTWPEFAVEVRAHLEKVLEVDPGNIEAKVKLAALSFEAISTLEGDARVRAYGMSLDPGNPEFNSRVADFLMHLNQHDKALAYYQYAAAKDPLSAPLQRGVMLAQLARGELDAGREANRRLREITGGLGGLWYFGMMHLLAGDLDAASVAFEEWAAGSRDDEVAISGRALVHLLRDETEDYEKELARLMALEGAEEFVAVLYAWEGRHDEAIAILDGLIDPPRAWGSQFMRAPIIFRDLEQHPEWGALLRKKGVHPEQVATIEIGKLFPGPGLPPTIPVDPP